MLRTLQALFDSVSTPPKTESESEHEHTLQLATAVLLVEVMRSDPESSPVEREAVINALRKKFQLADDELARLMELAVQSAEDAYDYHRFTSKINKGFSIADKVKIIELMWQVAYADGHLSAHENHLMRKVAALLYIPNAEYLGAKMRAKAATGLA
jgi:uncharacterized tellurite resistance protein B-like protein